MSLIQKTYGITCWWKSAAEFKKIKMSLGELKQITEGLVIDIASIAQNEIVLHVDEEKIASGELIIVGDRYGVKITKSVSGFQKSRTKFNCRRKNIQFAGKTRRT
ncbi:MAG: FliM/FliN family flagellar motor switch protein [Bacillus subtilis]|nr:FliM/FliN family flagellar motor switch protein [Bacillus subtilis]